MASIILLLLGRDRAERDRKERERKMLKEARRAAEAERKAEEEAAAKDKPAPEPNSESHRPLQAITRCDALDLIWRVVMSGEAVVVKSRLPV